MSFDIVNRFTRAVVFHAADASNITEAFWAARNSGADLSVADLRGADLSDADLRGAYLRGADLRGAYLRGADLRDAVLSDAVLRDADLRCADLRDAVLSDAVLSDADLRCADLRGADLSDAVLRGAVLRDADLSGGKGLPKGWERFVVPDMPKRVAEAVLRDQKQLEMGNWHVCETTHCLAGWAVHLAGPAGYALEAMTSTATAGMMLMPTAAHLFYSDNETALAWLKEQLDAKPE